MRLTRDFPATIRPPPSIPPSLPPHTHRLSGSLARLRECVSGVCTVKPPGHPRFPSDLATRSTPPVFPASAAVRNTRARTYTHSHSVTHAHTFFHPQKTTKRSPFPFPSPFVLRVRMREESRGGQEKRSWDSCRSPVTFTGCDLTHPLVDKSREDKGRKGEGALDRRVTRRAEGLEIDEGKAER